MPVRGHNKHGNGAGKKSDNFAELCGFIKDKCSNLKEDNISVNDAIEDLNDHFSNEGDKLSDTEKTALNVITLLLPVLNALVANRKDETLSIHETKINRLQVGVRKNEYASDALDQYSRRENVRITGIPEGEGTEENLVDKIIQVASSMGVVIDVSSFNDVHRLGVKRPGQNRQIIVRFMNRTLKIKFLSGRKNLKNTDYKNVFINEDLTKLRFKLFQMVRKCEEVKSASTRDGKIICYLQNGTKAVISSPDDLFKIGFQDVDYQKLGLAEL